MMLVHVRGHWPSCRILCLAPLHKLLVCICAIIAGQVNQQSRNCCALCDAPVLASSSRSWHGTCWLSQSDPAQHLTSLALTNAPKWSPEGEVPSIATSAPVPNMNGAPLPVL